MEIIAQSGSFFVGLMGRSFETKFNKKDGTLSVWGEREFPANVTTPRGTFIEVVDKAGAVVHEGGDGGWFYVPIAKEPVRLRFKKLADPNLSPAEINKARQIVRRYLVDDKTFSLSLPDTLVGTIKWMQDQLAAIPKAARDKAAFRFDTTMEYGESYPNIEITYSEPESDEEVIARVQIDRERARIEENAERAKFRELKSKFCAP